MKSLQDELEDVVKDVSGTFGVAVKHVGTGESADINGEDLFQTASACKVAILATLFNEIEKGDLSLKDRLKLGNKDLVPGSGVFQQFDLGLEVTVKDLAMMMIIVSDNQGTDKILDLVGKDKVNRFTASLGLNSMHLEHTIWELLWGYADLPPEEKNAQTYIELDRITEAGDDFSASPIFDMNRPNNVSSPYDMNRLLEQLTNKTLISGAASDKMLEILKSQQLDHRLPYLLPDVAEVANKTGTIGSVVNDVGMVDLPENKGCFVISVFSRGSATHMEAEQTIAHLSKTAYDHFIRK